MSNDSKLNFPWRITFDTNPDTCNLNCIMCEEFSPYSQSERERQGKVVPIGSGDTEGAPRRKQGERVMPFELIRKVVEEGATKGLKEIIPSTMGEPLLYKDFDRILDLCERHGLKLNLTTNGTFPRGGVKKWAPKIVPVTSDVKISWNGATKETHEEIMKGTAWEKVRGNVTEFIRIRDEHAASGGNRCRVTFQLTFLERNVAELSDIVEMAINLGVDRVKGHHLWAHFKEIEAQSLRRSAEAIARWNQAVEKACKVAEERRLPNGQKIILENIFPLDPSRTGDIAPGGECPFLGKEAWINAEGRFDPCCAPDEQRKGLGSFGKIKDQTMGEIWHGDAYESLVANYRDKELCRGCNMRKPVEGA